MFDLTPFGNGAQNNSPNFNVLMENLLQDTFLASMNFSNNIIPIDIRELEEQYLIEADLPGIKKEDVNISYENNYLTINANKQDDVEVNKKNFVRKERVFGRLERKIYMQNIDDTHISAKFGNGVLKIKLPKKPEILVKPKNIDIK